MKNLFDNLLIHESVLLILGIVLFLITSVGLIYMLIKNLEIKRLAVPFTVSIIMIGFSATKSIKIAGFEVELDRLQASVINPNDTNTKKKIKELTEKLEPRAKTKEAQTRILNSKIILNKPKEAIKIADKVIGGKSYKSVSESLKLNPVNVDKSTKAILKAYKLREVVEIQQEAIRKKDTLGLNKKLNLVLSKGTPLRLKPKELVKVNTTKQIKLINPNILLKKKQTPILKLIHPDSLRKK